MEMANYIMQILNSQQMVFWSWGPHRFIALSGNKGLRFLVQDFKHKGWVEVVYNEGSDLSTFACLICAKWRKRR